jgi:hypothetical protein
VVTSDNKRAEQVLVLMKKLRRQGLRNLAFNVHKRYTTGGVNLFVCDMCKKQDSRVEWEVRIIDNERTSDTVSKHHLCEPCRLKLYKELDHNPCSEALY